MAELDYSDDALNVIAEFYEAKKMFYVEGDDDVVFWEFILETFNIDNFKVQSVNGVEELKKLIIKVIDSEIDSIIARDLDFSILNNEGTETINVITTYGHSIENTILCRNVISKVIKYHGRFKASVINKEECSSWLESFYELFKSLVLYDASNEIKQTGISVLGSNCTRFMTSKTSPIASIEKINDFIEENKLEEQLSYFNDELIALITGTHREISDFMRGHFLFSASLKYVNHKIKLLGSSKTASENSFFSSAILSFESVFNESHPHYNHYKTQITNLEVSS